jgi:hypothetical protein
LPRTSLRPQRLIAVHSRQLTAIKILAAISEDQKGVSPTAGILESPLEVNAKTLMAVNGREATDAPNNRINNPLNF